MLRDIVGVIGASMIVFCIGWWQWFIWTRPDMTGRRMILDHYWQVIGMILLGLAGLVVTIWGLGKGRR